MVSVKVQEKIKTNKQLNRYDNVLDEMTEAVNETKDETKNDKNVEDQPAADCYDLGFIHSKLIKNVFCCLNENQQIGINEYHRHYLFFKSIRRSFLLNQNLPRTFSALL